MSTDDFILARWQYLDGEKENTKEYRQVKRSWRRKD